LLRVEKLKLVGVAAPVSKETVRHAVTTGYFQADLRSGGERSTSLPHQTPQEPRQDREQLGQLLRHAFPFVEGGSFAPLLESIRDKKLSASR
jgi:hypothetical protein